MSVFLLIRHAAQDDIGCSLAGRKPGVELGEAGRAQARRLGARLSSVAIDAIFTSPRLRARQTAAAIVEAGGGKDPVVEDALDEIDFGSWSGRVLEELDRDPHWRRWNAARSLTRTPAGEAMRDVQQRVLSLMERLGAGENNRTLALVSHADVIKAAVCYHLGLSVDAWPRFEISPASVTILLVEEWRAKLLTLNEVAS